MNVVVWHDLECHGYHADLALWRELARSPVLDVGAGTGRVALELAAAGHDVVALDHDPELLAALRQRAAARGLSVETVVADAHAFDLGRRFAAILVPMQTIQLLTDRPAFLRTAAAHLQPGARLAAAIADDLVPFEPDPELMPFPDEADCDGWHYSSQPIAVRLSDHCARIERIRSATAPDGTTTREADAIELATLDAAQLEREGAAVGLRPEPARRIAPTTDHVGSTVVVLRA